MPKEEKTVDIDTTGPGAEVNIEEEKKEVEAVETVEPVKEEPVEEKKEEVKEEKVEEKPVEEKKELEQYSEGVQKRTVGDICTLRRIKTTHRRRRSTHIKR